MGFARIIRDLIDRTDDDCELTEEDAYRTFSAILDGGVADLELGGLIVALHANRLTLRQLLGLHSALLERSFHLDPPSTPARPVVLPSRFGTLNQPNLLPLLALKLQYLGVPVLVHGALHGDGRIAAARIFRELGVMPCANLRQAQVELVERRLAFVPTAVLAPGLSSFFGLRSRIGVDRIGDTVAKLLDPFNGESLLVVPTVDEAERAVLCEFLKVRVGNALVLEGTEGEAFADPRRRPNLEYFHDGDSELLFDAETAPLKNLASQPPATDAASTALWIRRAVNGEVSVPLPLVNQIACCLYGSGYVRDMNQAKAIAAVETGSLVTG